MIEQDNGGVDAGQEVDAGDPGVVAVVAAAPKPAFPNGMVEKRWSGLPMWACSRCGRTTFDIKDAKKHACNGRV